NAYSDDRWRTSRGARYRLRLRSGAPETSGSRRVVPGGVSKGWCIRLMHACKLPQRSAGRVLEVDSIEFKIEKGLNIFMTRVEKRPLNLNNRENVLVPKTI